ncbi:carboxypeptidase-like regulatory domain-containing protein [Flavobacteriaceae bacterium]|nr:carboxypeptidase-like regulatory domain-containing protein [Flavobacteriaceae bacterium]
MKQLKTFNAKPFFLLGIALLSATFFVNAQTTISGNITDSSGPLPGVTILEKGTTNGTVSDFDGNYTLSVANQNSVLVFSYIGFLTQEITSDESGALDVQMQ